MGTINDWLSSFRKQDATATTRPVTPDEFGAINTGYEPIKILKVSTPGTEMYAGYLDEEYLKELRGTDWAIVADKMERSDPVITMVLGAMSLPLLSGNWIVKADDDSPEARLQKRLIEKALFEDIDETFTKLLGEILTFLRCGYSVFEVTHQVKLEDEELGPHTTLKSLGWRSQKTIERWGVDQNGRLLYVEQLSYGDTARSIKIPAEFIIHFCPKMEGNNFEGRSILRPMYGPWLRKNAFLKQNAVGSERAGTPTAILTVPRGVEASEEYARAIEMLDNYSSARQNMIAIPDGWKLEFSSVTYDPSKMVPVLDYEDGQMAKAILAQFLMLGQASNGGSLALGGTLYDFFRQSIQFLVDHIVETLEARVLKNLIEMNFGKTKIKAHLSCDSLDEGATQAWAQVVATMKQAGFLKAFDSDEASIRQKLKMPEAPEDGLGERSSTVAPPAGQIV